MKNYLLLVLAMTTVSLQAAVADIVQGASPNEQLWQELNQGLGFVNRVRELIRLGADVNGYNKGKTPLIAAIGANDVPLAKLLLVKKANTELPQIGNGIRPLHAAVQVGNPDMVKLLLQYKADIQSKDSNKRSPLDWAEYALQTKDISGFEGNLELATVARRTVLEMLEAARKQQQEK